MTEPGRSLTIPGWEKFQHYKHRNPPWIKLHVELLEDFNSDGTAKAYYGLSDTAKLTFIHLLCLRAKYADAIPYPNDEWLRVKLGLEKIEVKSLLASNMLALCKHDASAMLAQSRVQSRVQSTEKSTEGESENPRKRGRAVARHNISDLPEWLTSLEGWSEELWQSWLQTRTKKRASNSKHAVGLLIDKLATRKDESIAAIRMAVEAGWTGFEWGWYDNRKASAGAGQAGHTPAQQHKPSPAQAFERALNDMLIECDKRRGDKQAVSDYLKACSDKYRDVPKLNDRTVVSVAWQKAKEGGLV